MREFRTNRMRNSQQFDLPDDSGRSGEFHIVVGHVDAQGAATYGDRPMVDTCFGAQGDGGGAQARTARQRFAAAALVDAHGGAALVVAFALFVDTHEFNVLVAFDLGRNDRLGHQIKLFHGRQAGERVFDDGDHMRIAHVHERASRGTVTS